MAISRQVLGARLRGAREACGLTQQQVGDKLELSRASIAQMELGNREVTSLELDRLAYLYGRDIRSFLAEEFGSKGALRILLRADSTLADNKEIADDLRRYVLLGRELSNLESLLAIERDYLIPVAYPLGIPSSKWEAIQQGVHVAQEERRRMDLGDGPITDVAELLENQGIRVFTLSLPENVSGLTIREEGVGVLVAANLDHAVLRQRFSYTHEYAHVVLDRDRAGTVSLTEDRDELLEVRANSFAASFLLPEISVRRFVENLGKGRQSRGFVDVFDEEGTIRARRRSSPGSQAIQIYELVQLAYSFGVSTITALYRLRNTRPMIMSESAFERLKDLIDGGIDKNTAKIMELPNPDKQFAMHREFKSRFLGLALEAYRREFISRSKLCELADLVQVSHKRLARLIKDAGIEEYD